MACFFFNFDPWLTPLTKPSSRDNWVLLITPPAAPCLLGWACASWAHPSHCNRIMCSFCHFVGQGYQFHCLNNQTLVTVSKLKMTPLRNIPHRGEQVRHCLVQPNPLVPPQIFNFHLHHSYLDNRITRSSFQTVSFCLSELQNSSFSHHGRNQRPCLSSKLIRCLNWVISNQVAAASFQATSTVLMALFKLECVLNYSTHMFWAKRKMYLGTEISFGWEAISFFPKLASRLCSKWLRVPGGFLECKLSKNSLYDLSSFLSRLSLVIS